jgi:hypothetical protein
MVDVLIVITYLILAAGDVFILRSGLDEADRTSC